MRCRVEWDFWTSANDGCGNACDRQASFKVAMRETAQTLEKVIRFLCDCLMESHKLAAGSDSLCTDFARPRPRLLTEQSQLMMADQDTCCYCPFSIPLGQRARIVPLQHRERPEAMPSAQKS